MYSTLTDRDLAAAREVPSDADNGVDEMADRVALYELSGQFFQCGFMVARYGNNWKIHHP